jgi:transcriptional regulator with XRE-family HTH domain
MDQDTQPTVGLKIRAMRRQQGLSQRALAASCGLSFNAISKIERGESSPTVATLHRLAGALGIPILALFMDETERLIDFVQRGQGIAYHTGSMVLESLGNGLDDQNLQPFCISIEPGVDNLETPIKHSGEEFVHCLKGELEYYVDGQLYQLRAGDSLLFKPTKPHCWRNVSNNPARALLVIYSAQGQYPAHYHHIVK